MILKSKLKRSPPRTWEEHEAEMQRPAALEKHARWHAAAKVFMRQHDAHILKQIEKSRKVKP